MATLLGLVTEVLCAVLAKGEGLSQVLDGFLPVHFLLARVLHVLHHEVGEALKTTVVVAVTLQNSKGLCVRDLCLSHEAAEPD